MYEIRVPTHITKQLLNMQLLNYVWGSGWDCLLCNPQL